MTVRDNLCWLTLGEAAKLIRGRKVSPVELATAVLEHIEVLEPRVHAFITVDRDGALASAESAEREIARGEYRGPLHGVPLSLKDCFFTKGLRTTAASRIYERWVPDHDAAVVERLRDAGAVLLGKANMYELATGWGTTGHFPPAVNPWDAAYSPGGSSSGSAVAVATGMGYASVGTDGGGSVRVPANYCGVTGLKPTYGIISSFGTIPVGPSVSHVGIVARDVADTAHVLQALVAYDHRDPATVGTTAVDYVAALTGEVSGVRVGVPWRYIDGHVTSEVRVAFEASLAVLREAGAALIEFDIPGLDDKVAPAWTTIVYAELAAFHEEHYRMAPGDFGPELGQRLEAGLATTATDYYRAQEARALLRAEYLHVLRDVDLIATPTAPAPAPTMEELRARASKLQEIGQLARFTRPYNLSGLPAITVPGGFTTGGLPIGFELAGRPFEEALVLRAADRYQRATSWHERRAPGV